MEFLIIVFILLISVAIVIYGVFSHFKKSERDSYYAAAGNILREEFLVYSLKNTISDSSDVVQPNCQKMMLYIKLKNSGNKVQFVFDPEKKVMIGRDKFNSNIYINEMLVSQHHCCIYSENGNVLIKDLNSSNGTYVKRGLFKKFNLFNGEALQLRNGDSVIVGSNKFKITLFFYDMMLM